MGQTDSLTETSFSHMEIWGSMYLKQGNGLFSANHVSWREKAGAHEMMAESGRALGCAKLWFDLLSAAKEVQLPG